MPLPLVLIITALLVLVASILVVSAWRARRAATAPRGWTKTSGTVVVSDVRQRRWERSRFNAAETRVVDRLVPHIEYTYVVGGVEKRADAIDRGPQMATTSRATAAKLAARFPVGATVDVFVNPANADESALVLGSTEATLSLWVIAGVFVALAAVFPLIAR